VYITYSIIHRELTDIIDIVLHGHGPDKTSFFSPMPSIWSAPWDGIGAMVKTKVTRDSTNEQSLTPSGTIKTPLCVAQHARATFCTEASHPHLTLALSLTEGHLTHSMTATTAPPAEHAAVLFDRLDAARLEQELTRRSLLNVVFRPAEDLAQRALVAVREHDVARLEGHILQRHGRVESSTPVDRLSLSTPPPIGISPITTARTRV